jgi:pilus assembly protein Flp/PilA
MRTLLDRFAGDDAGQGLVEYAIIIAMVAIGLIGILVLMRTAIGNTFNGSRNELNAAGVNSY